MSSTRLTLDRAPSIARASIPRRISARASSERTASSTRDASVRVILQLDDFAHAQLGASPEGRRARDEVPIDELARRVRALSAALPRSCSKHAFELVVERPGLVCEDGDAQRDAVARCADRLGGTAELERLCLECAPAFAHVLWRLGCHDAEASECERALREWMRGEESWHRVFTSRIASEWGYLRMMSRVETTTVTGKGVVYRNVKTGESVAFRQNERFTEGR